MLYYPVQIEGLENQPAPTQPAVYVANHQSFLVRGAGMGQQTVWLPERQRVWQVVIIYLLAAAGAALCTCPAAALY